MTNTNWRKQVTEYNAQTMDTNTAIKTHTYFYSFGKNDVKKFAVHKNVRSRLVQQIAARLAFAVAYCFYSITSFTYNTQLPEPK